MNQFSSISHLIDRALDRTMYQALPTNIIETSDGFALSVKVPGVSRKDIVVDIQGRIVKITVNKGQSPTQHNADQGVPSPVTGRGVHLVEFEAPIKAERAFEFREALDAEAATLDLADGILTISVGYQMRGSKRTLTLSE